MKDMDSFSVNRIKVAIWGGGLSEWEGGRELLYRIVKSFNHATSNKDVKITLAVVLQKSSKHNADIINKCVKLDEKIVIYEADGKRDGKNYLVDTFKADAVLPVHSGILRNTAIPYASYIPDLQEEYLPQFFSNREILLRRKINEMCLQRSKYILVTSKMVENDLKGKFQCTDNTFFCQPCAPLSDPVFWEYDDTVLAKYNIDYRYFIICNQFWQHKNHLTAFKAINELVNDGVDIRLICTGDTDDYRNKTYINEIYDYIKSNGLENRIEILGYIPKEDQIGLLKGSEGVIQCTLFEGGAGGFSGQEAISYDRPLFLSDISINHELDAYSKGNIFFFNPYDYKELSKLLLRNIQLGCNKYNVKHVESLYNDNLKKLSDFYLSMTGKMIRG